MSLCDLSCASFSMRPMALKVVSPSRDFTVGFWPPKKLVTGGLRASCFAAEFGRGLELALGSILGWNVFAAGFGLNSFARTLNLVDALEEGVWAPLGGCEGPVGGMRIS
jgi:hypothetical protein